MSWNYRIVEQDVGDEKRYYIHEVYYDKNGNPASRTTEPCYFRGDSPEDVIDALSKAIETHREFGVLVDPWPDAE